MTGGSRSYFFMRRRTQLDAARFFRAKVAAAPIHSAGGAVASRSAGLRPLTFQPEQRTKGRHHSVGSPAHGLNISGKRDPARPDRRAARRMFTQSKARIYTRQRKKKGVHEPPSRRLGILS